MDEVNWMDGVDGVDGVDEGLEVWLDGTFGRN